MHICQFGVCVHVCVNVYVFVVTIVLSIPNYVVPYLAETLYCVLVMFSVQFTVKMSFSRQHNCSNVAIVIVPPSYVCSVLQALLYNSRPYSFCPIQYCTCRRVCSHNTQSVIALIVMHQLSKAT